MSHLNLLELTTEEMLTATGGFLDLPEQTYCFLAGLGTVLAIAAGNAVAAAGGLWYISANC